MHDRGSITVVRLALSLAQPHSLITHLSSSRDVDKTFKPLNPCCINMDNMHMVNVLILGRGAAFVFRCTRHFQPAAWGLRRASIEVGQIDQFELAAKGSGEARMAAEGTPSYKANSSIRRTGGVGQV